MTRQDDPNLKKREEWEGFIDEINRVLGEKREPPYIMPPMSYENRKKMDEMLQKWIDEEKLKK